MIIKYRAWDEEYEEMLECVSVGCSRESRWSPLYIKNGMINGFDSDNYVLMQYVGVNDKHDVEIYVDDIVTCYLSKFGPYVKNEVITGVVRFATGAFLVVDENNDAYSFWELKNLEVIGNTYADEEFAKWKEVAE